MTWWTCLDATTQGLVLVWSGVALIGLGYGVWWIRRRVRRPKTSRGLRVQDWIRRGR
ncbi:MAG: hypothetical protein RL885_24975 [Planctomycetota bacterium]